MIVGLGRLEQIGSHGHRCRRSDQVESGDFCRVPCRGFERNQRSHGMADQPCLRRACGVEQRRGPVGHVGDRRERRARSNGRGPAGPEPARQNHDGQTTGCAGPRWYGRSRRRAEARWSVGTDRIPCHRWRRRSRRPFTDSCIAQTLCENRSAWPRSSMMSEADSMPTDSRTSSSPTPAALSWAASIC